MLVQIEVLWYFTISKYLFEIHKYVSIPEVMLIAAVIFSASVYTWPERKPKVQKTFLFLCYVFVCVVGRVVLLRSIVVYMDEFNCYTIVNSNTISVLLNELFFRKYSEREKKLYYVWNSIILYLYKNKIIQSHYKMQK